MLDLEPVLNVKFYRDLSPSIHTPHTEKSVVCPNINHFF